MLDTNISKRIETFVYSKPRSVQEIAELIGKSWRTADRYVDEIAKEYGTIATKTFREGTRGALKIVYWASVEKMHYSVFQDKLAKEIEMFKKKEDFSAFDIFQHVPDKNKKAILKRGESEEKMDFRDLAATFGQAEKQILIFSGNLSLINLKGPGYDIFQTLDDLVKRGISIKIIARVDLVALNNMEKALSLNFKHGKELVEIRHCEQPLRAVIVDNKVLRIKEIKEPTGKINELNKRILINYIIKDKDWIEWASRIFWKLFSNSINSNKRIEELKKLG